MHWSSISTYSRCWNHFFLMEQFLCRVLFVIACGSMNKNWFQAPQTLRVYAKNQMVPWNLDSSSTGGGWEEQVMICWKNWVGTIPLEGCIRVCNGIVCFHYQLFQAWKVTQHISKHIVDVYIAFGEVFGSRMKTSKQSINGEDLVPTSWN